MADTKMPVARSAKKWFVFRNAYGDYRGKPYSSKETALAAAAKAPGNSRTVYIAEVVGRLKFTATIEEIK